MGKSIAFLAGKIWKHELRLTWDLLLNIIIKSLLKSNFWTKFSVFSYFPRDFQVKLTYDLKHANNLKKRCQNRELDLHKRTAFWCDFPKFSWILFLFFDFQFTSPTATIFFLIGLCREFKLLCKPPEINQKYIHDLKAKNGQKIQDKLERTAR